MQHAGEDFYEDYLVPKFENKNSVMIWHRICRSTGGCVSLIIVWQTHDWGNINAQTYCEHVIYAVLNSF